MSSPKRARTMGVVSLDALPKQHVEAVRELYGEPTGTFFQGRDGITCYHLAEPEQQPGGRRPRFAVLTHGIGTGARVYHPVISDALVACGFRVLRYSYYGHEWSYAGEAKKFDKEALQTQLFDLLDHVLKPEEPVDLFVGHSTGGILGVLAAASNRRPIRQLALISPAFWKKAPAIVKIADKIPGVMKALARNFKFLKLVENGYLENADNSFGHEEVKGGKKYFYPEEQKLAKENIRKMFALHPQIDESITGVATEVLREDLLLEHIPVFKELVASQSPPRIGLFWGEYDIVVPVQNAQAILSWPGAKNCVEFHKLVGLGHDSPLEDAKPVAAEIVKWVSAPSSAL